MLLIRDYLIPDFNRPSNMPLNSTSSFSTSQANNYSTNTDSLWSDSSDSGLLEEVIHGFFPKVKAEPPSVINEAEPKNGFVGFPLDNQTVYSQFGGFNSYGGEASSSTVSSGIFGDIFHYQEALSLVADRLPNA